MFFSSSYGVDNITPEELREKISRGDDLFLLDVRTPGENIAHAIKGSFLVPVNEVALRAGELPKDQEIVVYCRVGNRSAYAALYLSQLGYRVRSLDGGIVRWAMIGGELVSGGTCCEEPVCARA
jgi:rhodanese-related sulfurtransferase